MHRLFDGQVLVVLLFVALGCDGARGARSALVDYIGAVENGDEQRACESVWRSDLGRDRCDELARFVREHSSELPPHGRIEETVIYGHGAGAEIRMRTARQLIDASLICSTERSEHRAGRGCRWYVSSLRSR
jgi:hypothetical protein